MRFTDAEYPDHPYPGSRPDISFVHHDATGYELTARDGRWYVDTRDADTQDHVTQDLDQWLAERNAAPTTARVPLLAYGSNACPSKITWLRETQGLKGPVVVLRARTEGLAAVWAAGQRVVDDQRPATLTASPGTRETHAIWLTTHDQLAVLDVCEGRSVRYDLARIRTGSVDTENGAIAEPLAYVARAPARMPLLVDGEPVRCADVAQAAARHLVGLAATHDGLDREVIPPPVRSIP